MSDDQKRLDTIIEALIALAQQDFSSRAPVSDRLDEVDAIAVGINILAEELGGAVASRRELESAYAQLQMTQAQLVNAEKFAAIGQLANGVAHELNNPSSWILLGLAHAQQLVAQARANGDDAILAELDSTLSDARAGMERINVVVGELRTLSRNDGDVMVDVTLNEVVSLSCKLARPAYQNTAKVVLELGDIPLIRGSQARLGQLVTNLLLNAAQAMGPGGDGAEIVVSTRVNGDDVVLSVEDTGPGIPSELRERVFEPYFTTKPVEIGTGLGLALVRKIANAHGGNARVATGRRSGACIEVSFPAARRTTAEMVAQAQALAAASGLRGRLLIIDDEPMLLRAISCALDEHHDVVVAEGGAEALAVLERDHAFDLIICDLQMPVFDGVAVYEAVATNAPERLGSLVFMTGGAVTARVQTFLARTQPRVIEKPLSLEALVELASNAAAQRAS